MEPFEILHCISTGEMYCTYILCSKLSSKHVHDAVSMWAWLVVNTYFAYVADIY